MLFVSLVAGAVRSLDFELEQFQLLESDEVGRSVGLEYDGERGYC